MMPSDTLASLPNTPWLIGIDGGLKHAVPSSEAINAIAKRPDRQQCTVFKYCGGSAELVAAWGSFTNLNPRLTDNRCPTCRWAVAIERDAVVAELDAITPSGVELRALARVVEEPLMVVQVCLAILSTTADGSEGVGEYERDHPHIANLLGHATAHAAKLAVREDCADQTCDHCPVDRRDDPGWECDYPDADAVCATCSVRAGGYAGEWQGNFSPECLVPAPCSALTSFAQHYGISLGARHNAVRSPNVGAELVRPAVGHRHEGVGLR